jgi:hypothetical protein
MLLILDDCNSRASTDTCEFALHFPGRRRQDADVFREIQQRLRAEHQTLGRPQTVGTQTNHDVVNATAERDPWKNSTRHHSTRIGLSQPRVLEVILEDQQVPFRYSRIAHLPQTMALYTY